MAGHKGFPVTVVAAALAFATPVLAQVSQNGWVAAPSFASGAAAGTLKNGNFNTPEADGRPGVYFFDLGVRAFRHRDYRHAIDMYKVAASWAYKPAEYNLAVMYFKGQGIPVDRPRGAAWAILAAERNTPLYVKARDLMVTLLTDAQFQQTNAIWNQLKPTYGDAVALRRAKAQWVRTGREATGSHLGHGMGELAVGGLRQGPPTPSKVMMGGGAGGSAAGSVATSGQSLVAGGFEDGSVAYKQFTQSNNPYAPVFERRKGTVTVSPLTPVKPATGAQPAANKGGPPPASAAPQGG